MLKLVLKHGNQWRQIADEMGLKGPREAIFEFLKVEDSVMLQANKYLVDYAIDLGLENNEKAKTLAD